MMSSALFKSLFAMLICTVLVGDLPYTAANHDNDHVDNIAFLIDSEIETESEQKIAESATSLEVSALILLFSTFADFDFDASHSMRIESKLVFPRHVSIFLDLGVFRL